MVVVGGEEDGGEGGEEGLTKSVRSCGSQGAIDRIEILVDSVYDDDL